MIERILACLFPERLSRQDRESLQALRTALHTDEELLTKLHAQRDEDRKRVDGKTEAKAWVKSFPWVLWIIILILITVTTVLVATLLGLDSK